MPLLVSLMSKLDFPIPELPRTCSHNALEVLAQNLNGCCVECSGIDRRDLSLTWDSVVIHHSLKVCLRFQTERVASIMKRETA